MKKTTLVCLFSLCVQLLLAQNLTQTVRGKILDSYTQKPLIGATVYIDTDTLQATISNNSGDFIFEKIPVGRYRLTVTFIGYEPLQLSDVLVETGKETVKTILLQSGTENLETVIVTAERPTVSPLSVQTITVEQTQRFAATFYDPARLATSFAGVVSTNDQANNIVVRGNAPSSTVWWLEGVPIVNPNHTPNAGTFSDRVTQSGGGVNILSSQLLGDSYFLKGNYPALYSNALGGVLDMRLRAGNDRKREFTAQIGLIGIDLAAEGPFLEGQDASYLVNYRYSTLGILGALGVNLGDESIGFQDLSMNIVIPTKKIGKLSIFGFWGSSKNTFEAQRDTALWAFQKDQQDIFFDSESFAIGVKHDLTLGKNIVLSTVGVGSVLQSNRFSFQLDEAFNTRPFEVDEIQQQRIAFRTVLQNRINEKNQWKIGVNATQVGDDILSGFYQNDSLVIQTQGEGSGWLIRPFIDYEMQLGSRFDVNIGLGYNWFTFNQTSSVEPRASFSWRGYKNQNITFAYGLNSQLQQPNVYFASMGNRANQSLEMTKAHHFGLAYERTFFEEKTRFKTEIYYQSLFDVPVVNQSNRSFSVLNQIEMPFTDTLENVGTGRNYGVEFTLEQFIKKGFYYLATASLYESKYTAGDGIERDTRFNGNYSLVFTTGKEWNWISKKENGVTLGLNFRAVYLGGLRTSPIDVSASQVANQTVFIESEAFSLQNQAYFKIDTRLYYKRNHKNYTSTIALDIQNLTNQQNIAFEYFDTAQSQVVTKFQLGLIPILTYRVEF